MSLDESTLDCSITQIQKQSQTKLDLFKQSSIIDQIRRHQKRQKIQQVRLKTQNIIQTKFTPEEQPDRRQIEQRCDAGILSNEIKDAYL